MLHLEEQIFNTHTPETFADLSLRIFEYQYHHNQVYQDYCGYLSKSPDNVGKWDQIPFLPIGFFKTHEVRTGSFDPEIIFHSSTTTGMQPSRHLVKDLRLYRKSFTEGFRFFYGDPAQYVILALLPHYLERDNSSLVFMVHELMQSSGQPENGFYLYDYPALYQTLQHLKNQRKKVILFGVTFALLDFAELYRIDFPGLIIMETGGMKGRGKELVKEEAHDRIRQAFGVDAVHSEYGMCELLSQAYSYGNNVFLTPPWMKVILRDEKDPLFYSEHLETGVVNIIDLANIYSCSFIASDDLGRKRQEGTEILGRTDQAEIRGCNLLVL